MPRIGCSSFTSIRRSAAALASLLVLGAAHAQDFPAKPIHFVVPFAAGGAVDVLARTIGQQVSTQVGQPVIVDNKPGANGNLAPDFVAKSSPDGYTVLIAANGLATNPTLFPKLPFNVQREIRLFARSSRTWARSSVPAPPSSSGTSSRPRPTSGRA